MSALQFLLHVFAAAQYRPHVTSILLRNGGRNVINSIMQGMDHNIDMFGHRTFDVQLFSVVAMSLAKHVCDAAGTMNGLLVRPMTLRLLEALSSDVYTDPEPLEPSVWCRLDNARELLQDACQRPAVPHPTSRGI